MSEQNTTVYFEGHTLHNVHRWGAQGGSTPSAVAKQLFDRRWRDAVIEVGGRVVGEVTRHPDTGRRIWWAES